jgi:hypothetical protein
MKEKNFSCPVSLRFEWLGGSVFVKKTGLGEKLFSRSVNSWMLEAYRPAELPIFLRFSHCTGVGRVS